MLAEIAPSTEALSTETLDADSASLTQSRSARFNWIFGFWIAAFHIGAIAALFFFSWSALAVAAVLWVLGQNVGIGMSYHRLLTHRGYTTPKWVEYIMAVCGTLALQGGPIYWVAVHRLHHQLTDRPGDPHSPRDGKWWSHTGWILQGTLRNRNALLTRYAPDLTRDRFYVWLSRYHWVPVTVIGVGLYFAGGWSWVLLGSLPARHPRPACHLAGQLRDPHLGLAPLRHPRRLAQQLVGRPAHRRRGLA